MILFHVLSHLLSNSDSFLSILTFSHVTQQKITDVDEYFGRPFAVRLQSVCCPMYRTTNVLVHYLCTVTFVHKSSTEHLCTNGWRILRTSVCCPFVHERLTDITERKGKENSMKIKKITLSENASNYHKKKIHTSDSKRTANACPKF